MPKSKQEFERIREESRENILNRAIEVFAKKGYAAASIADIAEAAGVSVGLMYRYFRSKQDLFESIVTFAVSGLIEVTEIMRTAKDAKATVDEIFGELLGELENGEFINLNMVIIQYLTSENDAFTVDILTHNRRMFEMTTALIERGQREGVFAKGDAAVKSALLFSSIQGLTMMKFYSMGQFTIPSLEELTAPLYVSGV